MFLSEQLVLTGIAQRLSDAFGDGIGIVNAANDLPLRTITLQGLLANTNNIYVHKDSTVSSAKHGLRVNATDGDQPIVLGAYDQGPIKLSDFWVLGTVGETLCIGGVVC